MVSLDTCTEDAIGQNCEACVGGLAQCFGGLSFLGSSHTCMRCPVLQ